MYKKDLKCTRVLELVNLKFPYVCHRSKTAKAGPGYDVWPDHPSVQINSSRLWFSIFLQKLLQATQMFFALLSISFFVAFLEFM